MTNLSVFEIDAARSGERLRLTVRGELDLATASAFQDRLSRLRARRANVRLDLSNVEFMDCLGAHVLVNALAGAKRDGWRLEVEAVSPQIKRLFELTHLEHLLDTR
jgi:anti-sigma B factor antagonist